MDQLSDELGASCHTQKVLVLVPEQVPRHNVFVWPTSWRAVLLPIDEHRAGGEKTETSGSSKNECFARRSVRKIERRAELAWRFDELRRREPEN